MNVLVAQGVSWGYGPTTILGAKLNLELAKGKTVAVIGPNGAGKSTLLATFAGQIPCLQGSVTIMGQSLVELGARHRARQVAVLPQGARIDPELTVRELVELGRTPHLGMWGHPRAEDKEAIEHALTQCDLLQLATRKLGHLSGGEVQRAQLAMTVAQQAPLLLLDEPTTHLDLRRRHDLFGLLTRLQQQTGCAIVMVLHDLVEAYTEAHQVLVVSRGCAERIDQSDPQRRLKLAEAFGVPQERIP